MSCYYGLDEKVRLGKAKQDCLLEHFVAGTTARCTASLVSVNRNTSAYYFHRLREIITYYLEQEAYMVFAGEIKLARTYFGGKREGKRGRGTGGKVPVCGLLKRKRKVCTKTIPDASLATLCPAMERKTAPDSIAYSDFRRGYNVLDVSDFKHYCINHSKLLADRQDHINGIANFWNQAKRYLRKFNDVPRENFGLFLKECAWRFNNPNPRNQLR